MIKLLVKMLPCSHTGIEIEMSESQLIDNVPNEEAQELIYKTVTDFKKGSLGIDLDGDTVSISIGTELLGTMYINVFSEFYKFERSITNRNWT